MPEPEAQADALTAVDRLSPGGPLFLQAGYTRREPFGAYHDDPRSVFMEKQLGRPQGPATMLRTDLRPGDLGSVVHLHGVVYAQERGFDPTFEAYVAKPMAEFVARGSSRERLWIAERQGRVVGSVAVVQVSLVEAQLRWFLVEPAARGFGLGRGLLVEALVFCRESGYKSVCLWTESELTVAARLYLSVGFRKVEEKASHLWGVAIEEEKYTLALS